MPRARNESGNTTGASGQPHLRSVALVALGCSKNMVDAEMILGSLLEDGWALTGSQSEADMVVVNTCGFIESAREESVQAIVEALEGRRQGQKVVVAGCLPQKAGKELLAELPEIDAILGINAPRDVKSAARSLFAGDEVSCNGVTPAERTYGESQPRFLLTPRHHAYLRIADGCDRGCRFCAIPRIRGRQRSRTLGELVKEATLLAQGGCRELGLVAHDLNAWGTDLQDGNRLEHLLPALASVEGIEWIRLFYLYPAGMGPALIKAMATTPRVLPYIDMPLQHISDHMLSVMNRRITKRETLDLLGALREAMPHAVFRTTLLVGHPGETKADVEELKEFMASWRFQHLGAFGYSPEEGTAAFHMEGRVAPKEVQRRVDEVMKLQQKIAFELQSARVGTQDEVVVDEGQGSAFLARSWREAPDSDSVIKVKAKNLKIGQTIQVKIDGRTGYDLVAAPLQ
ncbi:MAG: 30S ribosomal protein S12 methylthiotransferase RimO [Planctomycetota bacterium]